LRVQPVCNHYEYCGGCNWQNVSYENQLIFKEKTVKNAMKHIAKLMYLPEFEPILGANHTEYYRNRMDYAFADRKYISPKDFNKETSVHAPGLGFHIAGRFDRVLDVNHCHLQGEPGNSIRNALKIYAIEKNLSFYNPLSHHGMLRNIIIKTLSTGEVMLIIAFQYDEPDIIFPLLDFIRDRFPVITSLYYLINPKVNDFTLDLPHILYHGKEFCSEEVNGIKYLIGPKSFFQTNKYQTKFLFDKVIEMANIQPHEQVLDLYCGVGSIALQIAKSAKYVTGVEYVPEAIEFAELNTKLNNIENASFYAGDVKDFMTDDFFASIGKPDIVITDPPRNGMDKSVVFKLIELGPERIVYVSCNPVTQARDLELMKESYLVEKIQPVDMFPHTYHIENIVSLRRINN